MLSRILVVAVGALSIGHGHVPQPDSAPKPPTTRLRALAEIAANDEYLQLLGERTRSDWFWCVKATLTLPSGETVRLRIPYDSKVLRADGTQVCDLDQSLPFIIDLPPETLYLHVTGAKRLIPILTDQQAVEATLEKRSFFRWSEIVDGVKTHMKTVALEKDIAKLHADLREASSTSAP